MAKTRIITAIDLGTESCTTLVASIDQEDQRLHILGIASVPSKGIRKSQIVNLEQALETLSSSVDAAERMAGLEIKSAFFSITGSHILSQNSTGVVAVASSNHEITSVDVDRVIEAARAISLPADQIILHVLPNNYNVDSQQGVKDPVGMTGIRLESQVHIITGQNTSIKNVSKCASDLGIEVEGFVFSALAASTVAITETEKELGVVLVDIGAGCTSICAYVEGSLVHSAVLPIGARHITQDIALGCRLSLEQAEAVKRQLKPSDLKSLILRAGESKDSFRKRKKEHDQLDVSGLGISENLSKKTVLEGIMAPRMKELFELVGKSLSDKALIDQVPAGLVLTGGGALTVGISEVAKRTLNLPARVGAPPQLPGMIEDTHKADFATPIGLLDYAKQLGGETKSTASFSLKQTADSLISFFKQFLP